MATPPSNSDPANQENSPKRIRSKTAKSRSGCRQCKVRKVKCDETQPECRNCTRKGLKCPGYKKELRWSSRHECHPDLDGSAVGESMIVVQASDCSAGDSTSTVCSDTIHDPAFPDPTPESDDLQVETVPSTNFLSLHTPRDLSSTLVEYWFSNVCPMWSTFDSEISYNRKLPSDTWTSSEPVFLTLQTMSAAYLADSIPQVNSMLPGLLNQATSAIREKMVTVQQCANISAANITVDLLFAVFALGTSMHWTDTSQFDNSLLQDASAMLGLWEMNLSAVDACVYAYFHQALTHWKMLLSVAGRSDGRDLANRDWLRDKARPRQALLMEENSAILNPPQVWNMSSFLTGSGPHSWCGLSSEVIDAFGQVVALCRSSSRTRYKDPDTSSTTVIFDNPSDAGRAWDLQQQLLGMDFDLDITTSKLQGISMRTLDEKAPLSHLVLTAEAYRLASLLQLHITFDSLFVKWPVREHESVQAATREFLFPDWATHAQKKLAMGFALVAILQRIPADSGSRCNQPVLLILAAAALKFDSDLQGQPIRTQAPLLSSTSEHRDIEGRILSLLTNPSTTSVLPDQPSAFSSTCSSSHQPTAPNATITEATLEVSKARKFVRSRLRTLRDTLPPKPIDVALDLIDAIWTAYDETGAGSNDVDWMDVMDATGLKTVFS